MNTLVHRIGAAIPDGTLKDRLRRFIFPILFTPWGSRSVKIGTPNDKEELRITNFPLFKERLGEREIEGYLKHYIPKPGDVAVNAGGYHGYFAMYLSRKVGPKGRVFCFEPDNINAAIIRRNLARNGCKNVTIISKGLWNQNASLAFETRGSSSRRASSGKAAKKAKFCRLDEELPKHGINSINFMNMDIEGAELEAVDGGEQIIRNSPRVSIAIASYHVVDGSPTSSRIEEKLKALGLKTYTGFPRHLTTYGY